MIGSGSSRRRPACDMDEPARTAPASGAPRMRLVGADARPAPGPSVASYRRLADVFHDLLSEQSLDSLLVRIADTLQELVPYEALHIYEADEARRELVPTLVRSEYADEIYDDTFPFGVGITGWAVEHREPVLANQAHLDPRVAFVPGTPTEPEALIVVPLIARGVLKGTLNVYRIGDDASFSDAEFELAQRLGDAAALGLDNAQIRARLEREAQTDSLTGLYNHRYFHERLRRELTLASADHHDVAVVMIDIDDFKKVNDVFGHAVGDEVLVELAGQLRATVRASDVVCRIGGEEFAIIVPRSRAERTLTLAQRLSERLDAVELQLAGRIAVSIGIAQGPEHAANPRELVACAEAAMMTAKARGKNQVVMFDETPNERPAAAVREDIRSIAHLKMLQSLAGKLNRSNDVREIGMAIANELRLLIDYHNCRVFVREEDELTPIAFQGDLSSPAPAVAEVFRTRVGEGITGHVVQTGEPLLLDDAAACEFAVSVMGTARIEESILAVPLNYGARVTGAIVVSKLGLGQFDDDDLRLLEVLAGHAAVALENARLYEEARREAETANALLEDLERTFLSTVEALANALEARDEYTSSHARWITDTALRVGEELGLDVETLKRLELGALFHDIGKIGIPNSVLLKPGPLTEEERALIETHPELGARIIAPIEQLQGVCEIVRACHERWDGAGYPDRKAGEEIPLEARIIFACDAFHAMTTDRPYRDALPPEEALRRLQAASGSQFDPRVVDVCLRVLAGAPAPG